MTEVRAGGSLHVMPLQEILEGVERRTKTGTLRVTRGQVEKRFFLLEGQVAFVTSNLPGERLGEYLASSGCLDLERMETLLAESRRRGAPFTGDLLGEKVFEKLELESALSRLAVLALAEALTWPDGEFELNTQVPAKVLSGPVQIRIGNALARALQWNQAEGIQGVR